MYRNHNTISVFQIHIQMISHTLKLQIVHITSRLVASPIPGFKDCLSTLNFFLEIWFLQYMHGLIINNSKNVIILAPQSIWWLPLGNSRLSYFYENQSYCKVMSSRLSQSADELTYSNSPETIHMFRESREQELCIAMT